MNILLDKNKKILAVLLGILLTMAIFSGCAKDEEKEDVPTFEGLEFESKDEIAYADQFEIFRYADDYAFIKVVDSDDIMVVPEGKEAPANLPEDVIVVEKPLKNAYLVATGVMSLFDAFDGLDTLKFAGLDADGWYIENAAKALEDGSIIYAGKYSAPDYEMLIDNKCSLAIENSMIYHSPEVKEKLEELGIPVFVERSSYESEPLGRTEWIKVFGALADKDEEAKKAFNEQQEIVAKLGEIEDTGKVVSYFFVNSNGTVVTRKSEDYVSRMIEIAGGHYVFEGLEDDTNLSTISMSLEEFYASAKDSDIIIYNSSIAAPITTINELIDMSPVFKDFKAVKNNNAWCTGKNMFQESDKLGEVIEEMSKIFTAKPDEVPQLKYFNKLELAKDL